MRWGLAGFAVLLFRAKRAARRASAALLAVPILTSTGPSTPANWPLARAPMPSSNDEVSSTKIRGVPLTDGIPPGVVAWVTRGSSTPTVRARRAS